MLGLARVALGVLLGLGLTPTPVSAHKSAMKRVFAVVGGATLAVAVLLVMIGWLLPRHWHVSRTVAIAAAPASIHHYVGDLKQWPNWADSTRRGALSYRYSAKTEGVGAERTWQGAGGSFGALRLVESDPEHGVRFESRTNSDAINGHGSVRYAARVGFVEVTWEDHGELPAIVGGFLLDDMQEQLGYHFEEGLERLKTLAEASAQAATPTAISTAAVSTAAAPVNSAP